MDDAKYVFIQDSREKKITAASASKRVGKTKKCTMPYENMTREERKKYMAPSEVVTFKLRPMSIREFRDTPGDKQVELLKWYGEKYGWSAAGVAAALDVTYATGVKLLEEFMLAPMFKARMREATKEQKRQFMDNRKELEKQRLGVAQEPSVPEDIHTPPEEPKCSQKLSAMSTGGYAIQLNLTKGGDTLGVQLRGIAASLDRSREYTVSLLIVELPTDEE